MSTCRAVLLSMSLLSSQACTRHAAPEASSEATAASAAAPPIGFETVTVTLDVPETRYDNGEVEPAYSVDWPLPRAVGGAPGVAQRMNRELTFEKLTGRTVEQKRAAIEVNDERPTYDASFQVSFNERGLVAISYSDAEACGAYCEVSYPEVHLFDASTGAPMVVLDLFEPTQVEALLRAVEQRRLQRVDEAIAELGAPDDELDLFEGTRDGRFIDRDCFDPRVYGCTVLVSPDGISFAVDYDFPNFAKGAEPREATLTWAELAPWLAPRWRHIAR